MRTERIEEIMNNMNAFTKERYHKDEVLSEMFLLQDEMIKRTFPEAEDTSALRVWDVENKMKELNAKYKNIADVELAQFINDSKTFCNLVKKEISGNRGEKRAFRTLSRVRSNNIVLKNIELSSGSYRTEIDALVITEGCIHIVEVKNPSRNIYISEVGNYYRNGDFLKLDCHIAEKMERRERIVREILEKNGITDVEIKGILVFTDDRIEVHNECKTITTCFSDQLAYLLDKGSREGKSHLNIAEVSEMIQAEEVKRDYPFEFDVKAYKEEFATLISIMEDAEEAENRKEEKKARVANIIDSLLHGRFIKYAFGSVAAAVIAMFTM